MSKVEIYHNKSLSLDLIEDTFKASFNIEFNKEYWQWRFLNNPNSDKTYISYIIEDGILAGYYAVSPMLININGKQEKIALSNMTMTHPNYRGKGYFKLLAKTLFDNLKEDGFIGVFGFANHNSHYGFRRYMNWKDLSVLNIFSVKATDFRNIKILENSVSLRLESVTGEIIKSVTALEVADKSKTFIERNQKNIEWRLKNNPSNTYKVQVGRIDDNIVSLLFYKNFKDEIDVMEFFYKKGLDIIELLNFNISNLIKETNSTINMWSNLHTDEHINLEKQGFQETGFNTYMGVIPLVDNEKLLNYKEWHYRFLDSDIF